MTTAVSLQRADLPPNNGATMSYMRGACYIWSDEATVHLWLADGDDGWSESAWAGQYLGAEDSGARPSGARIPFETLDELVAMRLAELIEQQRLDLAMNRALAKYGGNVGCEALTRSGSSIRSRLARVSQEDE